MTGNKERGLVLQDRDRHLLQELTVLRVIDREQAKILAGFQSTGRINKRLLALTRARLLRRFFIGTAGRKKSLYSLSPLGAEFLQVPYHGFRRRTDEVVPVSSAIHHRLGINDIYCLVKCQPIPIQDARLSRWENFSVPIDSLQSLIPDAYIEVSSPEKTLAAFLEFDLGHENLVVWKKKVDKYLQFAISGDFEPMIHHPQFRVLVVTNSAPRLESLRRATANLTDKIFWFCTMESIRRDGFWAPIWLRPSGDQEVSLL